MSAVSSRASREPRYPRLSRWLPWLGGLVFVAGVLAVLIAFDVGGIRNTAHQDRPVPSNKPASVPVKRTTVKPSKQALATIVEWIDATVARKNMATSYALTAPAMRQGLSLERWKTGAIPVQYFPISPRGAGYSPYEVQWSYRNELMLQVLLVPQKGKGVDKPATFWVGAKRLGTGRDRHWRVWYFAPRWFAPRPSTD
jgi:hypothetical protein